jgi:hypothetical protein
MREAGKKMTSMSFSYLGVLRHGRYDLITVSWLGAAKLQLKHNNTAIPGGGKYG